MTNSGRVRCGVVGIGALLMLSACSTLRNADDGAAPASGGDLAERVRVLALGGQERLPDAQPLAGDDDAGNAISERQAQALQSTVVRSNGNFINRQAASRPAAAAAVDGEVTLNFELADIRDVIKVVFDTLGENYILDPRVQGEVTVQTSRPLSKDLLIPTLETLLQSNGATLVRSGDVYRILPISEAVRGNLSPRLSGGRLAPGYSVRIFPLRFISAAEMQTILEPFAPDGGILLADPVRNLLILAGTGQELRALEETIDIFDVNWLKGMSVGMYVLENIESAEMATELGRLFGPESDLPLAGLFRFVPIERLNAIMVITPQAQYLDDVTSWIRRLDEGGGERLYVYNVRYSNAEYLASLLGQVYEGSIESSAATSTSSGQVAPNRRGTQLSTQGSGLGGTDAGTVNFLNMPELQPGGLDAELAVYQTVDDPDQQRAPGGAGQAAQQGVGGVNDTTRIVADTENNSLLIWASAQNYEKILTSLRRIDVPRRQVLIEATIAEVTLGDDLRYGLQWFFKNNNIDGRYTGTGSLDFGDARADIGSILGGGFSYALALDDQLRALLEILATENRLRVLSSPQVLVVDNQEASIQVGQQQPILSSTTTTDGGSRTENIQLKDTGVQLEVKPQINAGGLVSLSIAQEVTDVGAIDEATGQRSFLQRSIDSQVSVQSGQTIFLGGLIRETSSRSEAGIPVLHQLPVVGPLFGRKSNEFSRTELVIMITPRVINDANEASQVTEELRERMRGIVPLESPWKQPAPTLQELPPAARAPAVTPPAGESRVIILNDAADAG